GDAPQWVVAQVQAEQLLLEAQLFIARHWRDVDRQAVILRVGFRRADHTEQRGLAGLAVATRALRAAHRVVERRDQPGSFAQRVTRPRLHQCFEHPAVDVLDRRRALAEIFERLERTVLVAQSHDALHSVAADVLDRGQPEQDPTSTPLTLTLSPAG